MNSRHAIMAAVVLGALHDLVLEAVVGDHAVEEPDMPKREWPGAEGFDRTADMPESLRRSPAADLAGDFNRARNRERSEQVHNFADIAEPVDDTIPAAVSQDFHDGMEHARRQFASHEEGRYAAERAEQAAREDSNNHLDLRLEVLRLAVGCNQIGKPEEQVTAAQSLYDFICFGAVQPRLDLATDEALTAEITKRMSGS